MSLIPSESYSFPEDFTRTLATSRKPKNEDPESQSVESPGKKPAVGALPSPKAEPPPAAAAIRENRQSIRKMVPPMPNPALRRSAAPHPRISEARVRKIALPVPLKPKVRWDTRTPAMDPNNGNGAEHFPCEPQMRPAENVIQTAPPASPSRVMPRPENLVRPYPVPVAGPPKAIPGAPSPKSAAAANLAKSFRSRLANENLRPAATSDLQVDFFETFGQSTEAVFSKQRRKAKMRRFLVCESIAFGVLLSLVIIGVWNRPENAALLWILSIFTSAAAVVSAIIPILFFVLTPTSSEIEC